MTDSPAQATIYDDDKPLATFEMLLSDVVIGEDSTFRTQNLSIDDWERRNIIERTQGNIHIRVELMDVEHGTYDDTGDEATLMVFRFRFDPQKNTRRVIRARVDIEFLPSDDDDDNRAPIVDAIAPEQRWTVSRTIDQTSTTTGGEINVGAAGVPFLEAVATGKMEKTVSRDVNGATTVTGSINLGTGRNSGDSTVAVWNLQENRQRKDGVPDSVSVAVLLRREDNAPFTASVTLDADVDARSGLERKFMKVPLDDPVLFNPKMTGKRPKKGRKYGVENLGNVDLYQLCCVRMEGSAYSWN
ncbi:hypothetical protein LY76DRAFT_595761 [Colletotrichum caudatum]|nr:hypothetical protein LY76DRAFT_595761 [Colletotrichum caudatum]